MKQQEHITRKIADLCLFLQKQRDPATGIIHTVDNLKEIVEKFELGQEAMRKTLNLFYSYSKFKLTPKIARFYPNHSILESEYHYQNKLIVKKYELNKKTK